MGNGTQTVLEYRVEQLLDPVRKLDATTLKWIAMLAMVCDHFALTILMRGARFGWITPENPAALNLPYQVLRSIGRLSFPVFAYFIVEGFLHTRDWRKYLLKLVVFAFLSELPFDLAIYGEIHWQYQNVFFILALGVVMLELFVRLPLSWHVPVLAGLSLLSWLCKFDYMVIGLVLIAVFYWLRNRRIAAVAAGALAFIWEPWSLVGFFLLLFYNGERGRGMKYFFYLFYPVHLLLLYILWRFLL